MVSAVNETSALYGMLQEGDIITHIRVEDKSFTITRQYQLLDALLYARKGDTVAIRVNRTLENGNARTLSFSVVIGDENITTIQ